MPILFSGVKGVRVQRNTPNILNVVKPLLSMLTVIPSWPLIHFAFVVSGFCFPYGGKSEEYIWDIFTHSCRGPSDRLLLVFLISLTWPTFSELFRFETKEEDGGKTLELRADSGLMGG